MIPFLDRWTAVPTRQDQPEWLDLQRGSLDDVRESLSDISRINRWLGGRAALRRFLFPRIRQAGTKRRLRILDVGTGSAAVPLEIARWARRHEIPVTIIALDNNRRHLNIARESVSEYAEIQLLAADVTVLSFSPGIIRLRSIDAVSAPFQSSRVTRDVALAEGDLSWHSGSE